MSTTVGAHSGAGPLSLMSCVRESSPLQDYEPDIEKHVVSKRKFWNPKKWFRKKQKTGDDVTTHQEQHRDGDGSRSRSTGELSADEEPTRSHEVRSSSSMHPGLSVSHDSVFHPLNSGSSDLDLDAVQSSSSLSISQPLGNAKLQTELSSRLRQRRGRGDTSEDDEGLPRSPPCGSPAAVTDSFLILEKTAHKDLPTKSHSTCSDGSLLSMDGSEMDEDSLGLHSRYSSKVSLNEKRTDPESDLELGPSFSTTPLNHSAAHHRVSVRPKRTYGAPRRKKGQLSTSLPATPEVNEESSTRSISPESSTEPITELYSTSRSLHKSTLIETKLKCNSLPAGATPPRSESIRLNRSKSNAGKIQDDMALYEEGKEEKLSLFERLFPRRSGKKKKKDEKSKMVVDGGHVTEEKRTIQLLSETPTSTKSYTESKSIISSYSHNKREEIKPIVSPRTGAASRQRVQPIDIPVTSRDAREFITSVPKSPLSPDKSFSSGTSPIQLELESILKHRQMSQVSSSPNREPLLDTPPQSPKSPKLSFTPVISKTDYSSYAMRSSYLETKRESKTNYEDIRSKVKIAGLSSLQQRVLNIHNTDESDSLKSLTDLPAKPSKLVTKSHSFKAQKTLEKPVVEANEDMEERPRSVHKAASLDSVKNLEEPVLKSELKLTLKSPPDVEKKVNHENTEVKLGKEGEIKSSEPVRNLEDLLQEIKHADPAKIPRITQEEKSTHASSNIHTHSSKTFEEHSVNSSNSIRERGNFPPNTFSNDSITISGPSHTAVVNVTSKSEDLSKTSATSESEVLEKDGTKSIVFKENQVSVTKIHLKHETTQVTKSNVTVPKQSIPEFLNKQLNRVEVRPSSNIIFSMKSPKISPEEQQSSRPKTLFNFPTVELDSSKPFLPRKFSKEDVEIIEKESSDSGESTPKTPTHVSITPVTPTPIRFKKNDSRSSSRKSSVISVTPDSPVKEKLKSRSISLDSLKSDQNDTTPDRSSQDSLDKVERKSSENVVLRRKSLVKQKNEDEPELMKVFARRSLKLKDSDVEQIQEALAEDQRQRDSDKENNTESTPEPEKKILYCSKEENTVEELSESRTIKQPLIEIKKPTDFIKNIVKEEPDVQLRRSFNNNVFLTQRAVSMNTPKNIVADIHVKKQASLNERRKTDQWINTKQDEVEIEDKTEELISSTMTKTKEFQTITKNFSQRRAEWEKRVQQAQK